ncbi:hypothetical protein GY45DRAFT_1168612 [Cubamyces sp. BRFM 1775]|nr:hypothetical protein GY45DRAFT_1168612 [Cubamyces sp. BRFM 1775]
MMPSSPLSHRADFIQFILQLVAMYCTVPSHPSRIAATGLSSTRVRRPSRKPPPRSSSPRASERRLRTLWRAKQTYLHVYHLRA